MCMLKNLPIFASYFTNFCKSFIENIIGRSDIKLAIMEEGCAGH